MRSFVNGNGGGPAFLAARTPCFVAELFTVSLAGGAVYRWTSFDKSLVVGATEWLAPIDGAPLVTRNRWGVKNTIEVPEFEMRLGAADTLLANLKTEVHNGLFDGARVEMDRVFMPTAGDTQFGYVVLFEGRQSSAIIDAEGVTLTAKGDNVLMNQQAPRNLYQTNCLHTFCDSGCALAAANYTVAGTVNAVGNASNLGIAIGGGLALQLFNLGTLSMTSGAAAGQVRTIRIASASAVALTYPLYDLPSIGDACSLLMGCDRQQASCETRTTNAGASVNNIQHFRGYPYVPQAEIAV